VAPRKPTDEAPLAEGEVYTDDASDEGEGAYVPYDEGHADAEERGHEGEHGHEDEHGQEDEGGQEADHGGADERDDERPGAEAHLPVEEDADADPVAGGPHDRDPEDPEDIEETVAFKPLEPRQIYEEPQDVAEPPEPPSPPRPARPANPAIPPASQAANRRTSK
jgi:hypothetical protein